MRDLAARYRGWQEHETRIKRDCALTEPVRSCLPSSLGHYGHSSPSARAAVLSFITRRCGEPGKRWKSCAR
jgi:hypothetical protein